MERAGRGHTGVSSKNDGVTTGHFVSPVNGGLVKISTYDFFFFTV
jgi:hypothetical protein